MGNEEAFELLNHLGTGGFAHTYRAHVTDAEIAEEFGVEEVALKIPLNRKKDRILAHELEVNASLHLRIKALESQNIVRYLGIAVFRGQLVMAMEFVQQGNLRRLMRQGGRSKRLSPEDSVKLALGVLKGLMVIHDAHVFHRDIKPENILMAGQTPKIADLGLARFLDPGEVAVSQTGTIPYLSPEILSKQASFSSDVWSLGVTLYEMVTGKLPFGDWDVPLGAMVDLIREAPPVPTCEACKDIPRELSSIVLRALEKNPEDRFSSAKEMYDALTRFERGFSDEVEREMMAIRQMNSCEHSGDVEAKLIRLTEKFPKDSRAYQYLGEFYNLCQRYSEAAAAFKKGLKLAPNNATLHWDLALAYQKADKLRAATSHLEKAMKLDLDTSLRRHAEHLLKSLRLRI